MNKIIEFLMGIWRKISSSKQPPEEHHGLLEDIRKAHSDWIVAQNRMDAVVGKDQVDYAVFLLEAAEKRYDMLLKSAKEIHLDALENSVGTGLPVDFHVAQNQNLKSDA